MPHLNRPVIPLAAENHTTIKEVTNHSKKGILISKKYNNVYRVKYGKNIPELNFDLSPTPIDALNKKINIWSYEREYRVIEKTDIVSIGKITGIYFGIRTETYFKDRVRDLLNNSIATYETKVNFDKNIIVI